MRIVPSPNGATGQASGTTLPGVRDAMRRVIFGKRLQRPEREVCFNRQRLRAVGAELDLLLATEGCLAVLCEEGEPALLLGKSIGLSLGVRIEPVSGHFVLYEGGGRNDGKFVTASEDQLIDQVLRLIAAPEGEFMPHTVDAAVDMLFGRSLAEVERLLVLRTLRHFRGNRCRTAFALGIGVATLRARLRQYLTERARGTIASEAPR